MSHPEEPSYREQRQCTQASGGSFEGSRLQTTRRKERSETQLWLHPPRLFKG